MVAARPTLAGANAGFDDEFDIAVRARRGEYLRILGVPGLKRVDGGWRTVAAQRTSGSGRALDKRGLSLSFRDDGPIMDHGGRGYNDATFVREYLGLKTLAEGYAWLRSALNLNNDPLITLSGQKPEPVMLSQDERLPLAEAQAKVASVVAAFFAETVPAYVARLNAFNLERNAPRRTKLLPRAQAWIVRVEMGVGKSHAAIEAIARHVRSYRQVVYVVPNHKLAKEVAADFKALDIDAAVYHGASRRDPRNPSKDMCLNTKARKAAEDLGIGVRKAVCVSGEGSPAPARCSFARECGVEWQRRLQPKLWIVTAPMLMMHRPDFINHPEAVVIDEQFHEASIKRPKDDESKEKKSQIIDLDTLLTAPISDRCSHEETTALIEGREALHAARMANGDGPLSRISLLAQGFTWEHADWLSQLERRVLDSTVLSPDMSLDEMAKIARKNKHVYAIARALSELWAEVETFLGEGEYEDVPEWARLTIKGKTIEMRPFRSTHPSWLAPALILDATAPPTEVLQRSLDGAGMVDVIEKANISARWSDCVIVRQIIHAPVTMGKVGLYGEDKPENERDILRYIRWRAALAYPAEIGLITYKGLLEKLEGKLPKNIIVTAHFGGLAGLNSMKNVSGLIVLGRPYIQPADAEASAEVFGGRPVPRIGRHYHSRPAIAHLADGTAYDVDIDAHRHDLAEVFRWQATVRGLLQAVGRLRPHRRDTPCWLDLVCDVPLPIPLHSRVEWDAAMPGALGDMADEGVILQNRRDVAVAFQGLSERQGRGIGVGETGYDSLYINLKGIVPSFSPHRFTYRRVGARGPASIGYWLPGIISEPTALRDWLELKLRAKVTVNIEPVNAKDSPVAQAALAKIGRSLWQPPSLPMIDTLRAVASWIEQEAAGASDG